VAPPNILLIRTLALLFFYSAAAAFAQPARPTPTPSIVYALRDPAAIRQFRTDPAVVRAMVNRLVLAVTGQSEIARAWRTLVSPTDKVGIKISATGGELFTSHRDIVNALVDGLVAAGHSRSGIIVWDRQLDGIAAAGYRPAAEGYQLMSISPRHGYDANATFSAPVMGKLVWGDLAYIPRRGENPFLSETENTSSLSHFSKIVTSRVTKIINVPVLSGNARSGLSGCLYNVTVPNLDNWRRFTQFGMLGAAAIPEIYSDPVIAKKVVLHLMDGLLAEYGGGPQSQPNYAAHHSTLFASKDPVALDALALKRIEQWRAHAKLPTLGDLAAHVQIAGRMGLGNAELSRIELRTLGP
jgi:hypothetical protein